MATFYNGPNAPYMFGPETSWCSGTGAGTLRSRGFGSCVGLVLYCPSSAVGAVAHFSGSLGEATNQQTARNDADQILLALRPVVATPWNAWVFGGTSLSKTNSSTSTLDALDLGTSTVDQTKALIDIVRAALDADAQYQIAYQTDGYPGHSSVSLDLASGAVTFS